MSSSSEDRSTSRSAPSRRRKERRRGRQDKDRDDKGSRAAAARVTLDAMGEAGLGSQLARASGRASAPSSRPGRSSARPSDPPTFAMDADDLPHHGDAARHAAAAPEQLRDGQRDAPPTQLHAVEAAPAAGGHPRADPLAGARDPW
eukprot:7676244-Pyramimonas_sp.AAC.1